MRAFLLGPLSAALFQLSCADTAPPDAPPIMMQEAVRLPPLGSAQTTLDATLAPAHPIVAVPTVNPALIENQRMYLDAGFGVLNTQPGESHLPRTLTGGPAPARGPNARRLVRFVHLADVHVTDDESPIRFGMFDLPRPTDSALRPQDSMMCRMLNAAVRTINALHRQDALAFTLMGGDNIDTMQGNELSWLLNILDGGKTTRCDSGEANDPIAGPGNDGKDAFISEGLAMPWRWVTGNHDVTVQGFVPWSPDLAMQAVGSESVGGTRDYARGGSLQVGDFAVRDAQRGLVRRAELLKQVQASGDGHGLGATQLQLGKAFYFFDVKDTPLRFLILDTGSESGGSEGMLHRAEIDAHVTPILDEAKRLGKAVIMASHHAVDSLSKDGGPSGTPQSDAMLPADWKAYLDQYPNVVFSMNAHYHRHQIGAIALPSGRQYWQILTGALADFPHSFRVVEIWDEDNGFLMMRATCVNLSVEGDEVAEKARALGTVDLTAGFNPNDGRGQPEDRNVELYIAKP